MQVVKCYIFFPKFGFNGSEINLVLLDALNLKNIRITGLMGMSAMSYGALGENPISSISQGLGMATGSWLNTGEGGLAPCHQIGKSDIIMQIGPGSNYLDTGPKCGEVELSKSYPVPTI